MASFRDSPAKHLTLGLPNAQFSTTSSEGGYSEPGAGWPEKLEEAYDVGAPIGRGATSEVFAATHRTTGEAVALKRVYKPKTCTGARRFVSHVVSKILDK